MVRQPQFHQGAGGAFEVAVFFQQSQRALVGVNRFLSGKDSPRLISSQEPVIDGFVHLPGLRKVPGQQRREAARSEPIWIQTFQCLTHRVMEHAPVGFQDRSVGGLLHQRMPEEVLDFRLDLREVDQAGGFEGGEAVSQRHGDQFKDSSIASVRASSGTARISANALRARWK